VTTRYALVVGRLIGATRLSLDGLSGVTVASLFVSMGGGVVFRSWESKTFVAMFGRLDHATGDLRMDDTPQRIDAHGAMIDQFLEWYFQFLPTGTYTVTV
jgi:hypothetical protein